MISVKFYEQIEDDKLKFAVILSKSKGKWVFCKHKERNTLEVPGGHREPGEDIEAAARRELHEETGAIRFSMQPVCVYAVIRDGEPEESCGMLFFAEIEEFEEELHSEMEKIVLLDVPPEENLTYPDIQPKLWQEAVRRQICQ